MAAKRKNLFLYLTLACFLGLIAIFIVDGYMGVYDTVSITAEEQEQKISPDNWLQRDFFWSTGVSRGGKAFFRYEVDNRQFSVYTADVEVSLWHSQEKVADLISKNVQIAAFGKEQIEWAVDTAQFLPADLPQEQSYQYTVIIKRGGVERRLILHVNPTPYVPKPIPPVVR